MSEEKTNIPSLTLDPNGTQAAAQEAPAEEEVKTEEAAPAAEPVDLSALSPAEQAAVQEFAQKIDVMNTEQVMNYGAAAQKNIAEFSDAALKSVRTKDLGEVGGMLGDLVVQLQGLKFEPEEKKGLKGLFKRAEQSIATMKAQYDRAQVNVDKIVEALQAQEMVLMRASALID